MPTLGFLFISAYVCILVKYMSNKTVSFRRLNMFCTHCGKQIEESVKFCQYCGRATSETPTAIRPYVQSAPVPPRRRCPSCGSHLIQYQTVTESISTGCFTAILYILLAITVLGLLIVIPLMLRKKTKTSTYAVCQNCGRRWKI